MKNGSQSKNRRKDKTRNACRFIVEKDYLSIPLFSDMPANDVAEIWTESCKNIPVSNLTLSVRCTNILQSFLIQSVGELLNLTPSQLIRLRNCGVTSIKDFQAVCHEFLVQEKDNILFADSARSKNLQAIRSRMQKPIEELISEPFSKENLEQLPLFSGESASLEKFCFHESYRHNLPVASLAFDVRSIHALETLQVETLGELLLVPGSHLSNIPRAGVKTEKNVKKSVMQFYLCYHNPEKAYKDSFEETIKGILQLKASEWTVFQQRYWGNEPKTLQDIGNEIGKTRERIRQVLEKIDIKLESWLTSYLLKQFYEAIDAVFDQFIGGATLQNISIDIAYLFDWKDEVPPNFLRHLIELHHDFDMIPMTDIVVDPNCLCLDCEHLPHFIEEHFSCMKNYKSTALCEEFETDYCIGKCGLGAGKQLDPAMFENLLADYEDEGDEPHFVLENGTYFNYVCWLENHRTLHDHIDEVLRMFQNPVHVSEIAEYIRCNTSFEISQQNLHSRLTNAKYAILWDRGTFLHSSHLRQQMDIIPEIENKAYEWIKKHSLQCVYVMGIFSKNQSLCEKHGINTPTALYSLLRLSKPKLLSLPKYPQIYLHGMARKPLRQLLEEYLSNNHGRMNYDTHRRYYIETIGVPSYILQQEVNNHPHIVVDGHEILLVKPTGPGVSRNYQPVDPLSLPLSFSSYFEASDELSDVHQAVLTKLAENKGELSRMKLDIMTKRMSQNHTRITDDINRISMKRFNREFMRLNHIGIWEVDSYFIEQGSQEENSVNAKSQGKSINSVNTSSSVSYGVLLAQALEGESACMRYWIQALKHLVDQHRDNAPVDEVAMIMCAYAWQDVLYQRVCCNEQDSLVKVVRGLYFKLSISKDSSFQDVIEALNGSSETSLLLCRNLTNEAPCRLLKLFLELQQGHKENDTATDEEIIRLMNTSIHSPYKISKSSIILNQPFIDFIREGEINV